MDFSDLCRFCLKQVDLNDRSLLNETVKDQFEYLTSEKLIVHVGSDFSCQGCLGNLKIAHFTKEIFLKNQEILVSKSSFIDVSDYPPEMSELEVFIKEEYKDFELADETKDHSKKSSSVKSTNKKKEKEKEKEEEDDYSTRMEEFICPIQGCEKKFVGKSAYFKHRMKHKKELKLTRMSMVICDVCGLNTRLYNLSRHKRMVHEKIKNFECDVCGHGFYIKRRLADHLKAHFQIYEHECDLCQKKFSSRDKLTNHKNKVHNDSEGTKRTCELCGKVYKNKQNYEEHYRAKHTGERPLECKVPGCEKKFAYVWDLYNHKKFGHAEKKLQSCPLCFKQVYSLKSHKRTVHSERKVICDFVDNGQSCGKKFLTQTELKNHFEMVHCNVRKYFCPVEQCNNNFRNSGDLRVHILNIHEHKKIKCDLCNALLGCKGYYTRHVKSHHRELDETTKEMFLKKIRDTKEEALFNHQK